MDLERLRAVAQNECRLQPGHPLLVGVSGGGDSLALLHGLWKLGYSLIAAHFDHRLRPDSQADAQAVEQICQQLGVEFRLGSAEVAALAQQQKKSLEVTARQLRYQFLFEQARQTGAQAVAVGHHAGDQAETVLMHILRGAGLRGLRGMRWRAVLPAWDAQIPLVRPLLGFSRADLHAYCAQNNLSPRFDSTNDDPRFFRNRLRLEIFPLLEQAAPGVGAALARLAEIAADESEIVDQLVEQAWHNCLAARAEGQVLLRRREVLALDPPLRRALLRRAASVLLPAAESLDFAAARRADHFVESAAAGQIDLGGSLVLHALGDHFCVTNGAAPTLPAYPRLPGGSDLRLSIPGKLELPDGWRMSAAVAAPQDLPPPDQIDRWQAWLDAACLPEALLVRAARPGERVQPLGLDGHTVKLSDLWINNKIPRPARAGWPLVASGGAIVWVPGLCIAAGCRVGPQTARVVRLRMWRENPTR